MSFGLGVLVLPSFLDILGINFIVILSPVMCFDICSSLWQSQKAFDLKWCLEIVLSSLLLKEEL